MTRFYRIGGTSISDELQTVVISLRLNNSYLMQVKRVIFLGGRNVGTILSKDNFSANAVASSEPSCLPSNEYSNTVNLSPELEVSKEHGKRQRPLSTSSKIAKQVLADLEDVLT